MEKEDSKTDCRIGSLEVLDLGEENLFELLVLFTRPSLPITNESVTNQEDVKKRQYLSEVKIPNIPNIDADVVVFDCSAKYHGKSLNDKLLLGPDLTNSLIRVLTRFRQDPVAFMSDMEAMFHQVCVNPEDRNALRFLWWPDGDLDLEPEEYMMTVHLFGAVSSPSCANFALKKTVADNEADFSSEAVRLVKRDFYVDDRLKSVDSQDAIHLSSELS